MTLSHLGSHLSVFTMPNTFGLDRWQTFCRIDERMVGLYTARENREVRVNLGFTAPADAYGHRDVDAQKALLRAQFADDGWWVPAMLTGMDAAADFYLAPMTQVHMSTWSRGRIALLGDAAWCATPLAGQGTSLAMVGAYVLATELGRAPGDHASAFAAYERRMARFVAANQELALVAARRTEEMIVATSEQAGDAMDGFDMHWVASAATAIDLDEEPVAF